MGDIEKAGWKKTPHKNLASIAEKDIVAMFRLADQDKSGAISERVRRIKMHKLEPFVMSAMYIVNTV